MLMKRAELAAYVRDVKPESDVHSTGPLWKTLVSNLQFLQRTTRRGTNAMFWRFDCDGGDEC